MDFLQKIRARLFLGNGRDALAGTFNDELHYQSGWVLLFACAMSVAWLGYTPVDALLHPEYPIIIALRWMLIAISVIVLLLRRVTWFRRRSQLLLVLWSCYTLTVSGVIAGLTAVDPSYVAGFVMVFCLIPMLPLQVAYSFTILVLGIGGFLLTAWLMSVDLTQPRTRYSINDILIGTPIVVFFILLMNTYRYRTWKSAKIIERESALRVQQADSENEAKSRFIATMSHEIRTPMNGILGMAEMLQTTQLDREQKDFVDVIAFSSKSLLNVINDVLDYSKIEAGRVTLEKMDFNLYELCAEVASLFKPTAQKSGLEFVVCVDPAVPILIKGDPSRLRQVLLNLIGNAFKFTRVGRVQINLEKGADSIDGGKLEFTILDTGIGISAAQQATLFKPFQQADSSITREYGGTGLGLSISKSLIELMGGDIGVESAPRQGSTFHFSIRYEIADTPISETPSTLAGMRMLLVGRSSHYGRELSRHLQSWRVTVDTQRHIVQATDRVQASREGYAAVILDLDNNGDLDPQHVEALQEACSLLAIPCLVISSEEYPRFRFRVQNKPVCGFQFRALLEEVLGFQHLQQQPVGSLLLLESELTDCSVLVVEDNEINQKVITAMLDKLGARYSVATNGEQACVVYRDRHQEFDVILMDCEMPVLDGEAATRRIRAYESEQSLPHKPIIALTAHAMQEHIDTCLQAGMDNHIAKPVEMSILQDKIIQAVKSEQSS